nr:MAG: WbqC-like protein [Lokiarchaeota virus Ratatoskr Meg22_1012]
MMRKILIDYIPFFGTIHFWRALKEADVFVVLDREKLPQLYNKCYGVTIPVINNRFTEFEDIRIYNGDSSWQRKLWKKYDDTFYKFKYYKKYRDDIKSIINGKYHIKLFDFFNELFTQFCLYLDINTPVRLQSDMPYFSDDITENVINISEYFNADITILPPRLRYEVHNIKIVWKNINVRFYKYSVFDISEVLFKNGDDTCKML